MKKMIVMLAAVALAAVAHASSVNWGLSAPLDVTKIAKGTMYFVYTANASGIDWSVLDTKSTYDASTIRDIGFEKTVAAFSYSDSNLKTTTSIKPWNTLSASASYAMYMICIDEAGENIAFTTTPGPITVKTDTSHLAQAILSPSAFSYAEAGVIPEPTSGLLLLLGMAGLALKRKVA